MKKYREINLLIIDDHPMIRSALHSMFKQQTYIQSINEAQDGLLGIKHLNYVKIDVVLLDISMPNMNGIQCIKEIKQKWPSIKVIVLTQFSDNNYFHTMMNLGADGYLLKSTTENELIRAFEKIVFEKETIISPTVADETNTLTEAQEILGQREFEVLTLICSGLKSHEIAQTLHISIHTVNNHRKSILKKTNSNTTPALVQWAKTHGIY